MQDCLDHARTFCHGQTIAVWYACQLKFVHGVAHPLHRSEKERQRDRETAREIKREEEGGRERKKERERVRKRRRERKRELSRIVVFILKGMTGALAPFSYLVDIYIFHELLN